MLCSWKVVSLFLHAAKDDGKKDTSDKVLWHRVDNIDGDDCYGFLTEVIVFPT